jgi:hypothetical protein
MTIAVKDLMERVAAWPAEDVQELEDYARVIRQGVPGFTSCRKTNAPP